MQFRRILCGLVVPAALGVAAFSGPQARAADDLSAFMKVKLRHAEKVLEGLATEDFELIVKNSQAISLLCEDEMWSVLQTPEYRERSLEFRRSVNAITEAARNRNLEGAAFSYIDSTMKCVSCHKYVRKTRAGQ
jgi:cytochrome c556